MPPFARCAPESLPDFRRPAVVVGHPGHELRVFGWLSEYKPRVYVITDGSGRHGVSRMPSTAALLAHLGAQPGEIFGSMSDAEIYDAILQQDFAVFIGLVDQLADSFLEHHIDSVVGDAAEGFNPTHDLCRGLINAAVLLVKRRSGRAIANFEVSLTEWEHGCADPVHDHHCRHWLLDDRMLAEKVKAAERYIELKEEVQRAIAERGEEYFRLECLRSVGPVEGDSFGANKPAYEVWGERRVAEGEYQAVIRFEQHLCPILRAILDHADRASSDYSLVESVR